MTQQSVYVQPGTVTTVHPQLAAGATIYNGDANNAVWVSSSPSVSPNNGMRIGPKGSLQWTSNNAPCYACTDVNSTAAVTITVSTDIQNLNNPVDIGVAVATQLLAQGVPSVFQGDVIASGTALPVISGNNRGLTNLDVSRYASLAITLDTINSAQVSATCTDVSGGNLGSFDFPITHSTGSVTFLLPVTGPRLSLTINSLQSTAAYTVYGSNRAVTAPRVLTGYSQNNKQLITTAFTDGMRFGFSNPFFSNGKPIFVRMVVTGTGVGKFGYVGFDAAGVEEDMDLLDSAVGVVGTDGKELETTIILPPGILQLYYRSNVAATYTVVVSLVQEH